MQVREKDNTLRNLAGETRPKSAATSPLGFPPPARLSSERFSRCNGLNMRRPSLQRRSLLLGVGSDVVRSGNTGSMAADVIDASLDNMRLNSNLDHASHSRPPQVVQGEGRDFSPCCPPYERRRASPCSSLGLSFENPCTGERPLVENTKSDLLSGSARTPFNISCARGRAAPRVLLLFFVRPGPEWSRSPNRRLARGAPFRQLPFAAGPSATASSRANRTAR